MMDSTISFKRLPNGIKVVSPKKDIFQFYDETTFFYDEVQNYFKHGITCSEGDTIFDIGANIGLFAMHACQKYNRNINIYAFEPIPQTFAALARNIQSLRTDKVKTFPFGLSNESKIETFSYHPNAPGLSSMYPIDSQKHREDLRNNLLENLEHAPFHVRRLIELLPPFLRSFFIDGDIDRIFKIKKVNCQLDRLSNVIRENNIQKIDLLKIDAERSELEVFLGIESQDWQKIRQVVVEVHDIDDQLNTIKNLLVNQGFSKIVIEQDPFLKASNNFNLYATRS